MTLVKTSTLKSRKTAHFHLWKERILAILALINFLLVLFDYSYIPLRNFWLEGKVQLYIKIAQFEYEIPSKPLTIFPINVTTYYDWVKAIEPYRDTQQYLNRVNDLETKLNQSNSPNSGEIKSLPLQQQETVEDILKDLRKRSIEMIEDNPFQSANKTGTLERIKNRMRQHIFQTRESSAKQAFSTFWSQDYLQQNGFPQELQFFNEEIRPLIATNYFRPVGENGEPVDNFCLLDFPFLLIFLLDFLMRTYWISKHYKGVSWFDAMLWRWYDIFLIIPVLRWLRIIPVTLRLDQAKLINLKEIKKQASKGFVASIATDMTEVVVVTTINKVQTIMEEGMIENFLNKQHLQKEYIDLNNTNEIAEIIKLMSGTLIEQVLPKIRPDIEALLKYNIEKLLNQSSAYQGIRNLPGIEDLQSQLTTAIISQVYQISFDTIKLLIQEDPEFDALLNRLIQHLSQTLNTELKAKQSLTKIELLISDLLEEIKVNYIQNLSQEDIERILEETRELKQNSPTID